MKIKNFLTLLLSGIMMFGLVACKSNDSSSSDSTNDDVEIDIGISEEENIYNLKREIKSGVYKGTCDKVDGKYIIAQNRTAYKIVLSKNPTSNEQMAASELQVFLQEATGLNPMVPFDFGYNSSGHVEIVSFLWSQFCQLFTVPRFCVTV